MFSLLWSGFALMSGTTTGISEVDMSTPVHVVATPLNTCRGSRACRARRDDAYRAMLPHKSDTSRHVTTFPTPKCMGYVACRVETWRDEPSGIWALSALCFTRRPRRIFFTVTKVSWKIESINEHNRRRTSKMKYRYGDSVMLSPMPNASFTILFMTGGGPPRPRNTTRGCTAGHYGDVHGSLRSENTVHRAFSEPTLDSTVRLFIFIFYFILS